MEAAVLTGMVEGRRARGRQIQKFMDVVTRVTDAIWLPKSRQMWHFGNVILWNTFPRTSQ